MGIGNLAYVSRQRQNTSDPFTEWRNANYKRPASIDGESYDTFIGRGGTPSAWDNSASLREYEKINPDYGRHYITGEDPDVSGGAYRPGEEDPDVIGGTYQPTITIGDPTATDPSARNFGDGTPGSSNSSGFSMQDLPQWLQDALGSVGGSLENYAKDPNLLAAIAGAWNSYNTADKYGDMGKSFREEGNPFGQYRPAYGQRLEELYNDPSSLENSAAYKARMSASMNALGPQLAAKGGGFGNITGQMMQNAQDIASQEYDKEWQRRYDAAGGKFGPDASIRGQLDAARLEAEAKNAALDQLFTPFGRKPDTGNGSGTGGGGTIGMPPGGFNGGATGKYQFPPAGQIGATGTWNDKGQFTLKDGTVIDVTKLSDAARAGDETAKQWLYKISGGSSVDDSLQKLGVGFDGGATGDPYNPDPGDGGGSYGDPTYPNPYPYEEQPVMPDDYLYEGLNTWYEP